MATTCRGGLLRAKSPRCDLFVGSIHLQQQQQTQLPHPHPPTQVVSGHNSCLVEEHGISNSQSLHIICPAFFVVSIYYKRPTTHLSRPFLPPLTKAHTDKETCVAHTSRHRKSIIFHTSTQLKNPKTHL